MRQLAESEVAIQIWSQTDPQSKGLDQLVRAIVETIGARPELGSVVGLEGPTAHIPDYFSELYGSVLGWLIYVTGANPIELKRLAMSLEQDGEDRLADIDVFTGYFEKISRRDLGKTL